MPRTSTPGIFPQVKIREGREKAPVSASHMSPRTPLE